MCDLSSQHYLNISGHSGSQELAESAGECSSVRKGKEDERAKEVWQEGEGSMGCHVRAQQDSSTTQRTHFSSETSVDSELVLLCHNVSVCMCTFAYACMCVHMYVYTFRCTYV